MKIQISHISILSTKLGFKYIKKVTDDTNQGGKELGSQDDLRQKANIYHSNEYSSKYKCTKKMPCKTCDDHVL